MKKHYTIELSVFTVKAVNQFDSRRYFDKISRFSCHNILAEIELEIDINTELCPLHVGEQIQLSLTSSLGLRNKLSNEIYSPKYFKNEALGLQNYEYIMHGKIYKVRDIRTSNGPKSEVYISYGGLLMLIIGDSTDLEQLELDEELFLLKINYSSEFLITCIPNISCYNISNFY